MPRDIVKARARQLRYAHSEKGQAARRRYDLSPKKRESRLRHEATRGYHRKALKRLAAERERITQKLEEMEELCQQELQ